MATVAAQKVVLAGLTEAFSAASAGGDKFKPDSDTFLHVKNGSVSSINVTVTTPGTVVGQDIAEVVVAVGATSEKFIGPFPPEHFRGSDGLASVAWSATATVTFAVLQT